MKSFAAHHGLPCAAHTRAMLATPQVQRSVIKELFNFFVAPVGGWQYLDLGADLTRRPACP